MTIFRFTIAITVLLALFSCQSRLIAQSAPTSDPSLPTLRAAEYNGEIRIDGHLDEEAWRRAEPVSGFIQGEPIEGIPAEEDTEVRILYSENAIYVGARMFDSDPASIARHLTRRDERRGPYDYFEASFDSNLDRRTAYTFRVTAAGVQVDLYRYDAVEEDESWNAVWESAVEHDERGWTAEMRLPLSQIRYAPSPNPQAWGINFVRRKLSTNEMSYFALESRERQGGVSVYGRLIGLELPTATRHLEIRPYALARTRSAPTIAGNPFFDGSEYGVRMGGGLRYGLGSTFVLDATVNPDFGQVEVDPAVINLTAFETFFPEKRPFFTRDDRLFDFTLSGRQNTLFYSRRIGREPQGRAPDGADFVDVPGETDILGAAKITGRIRGGLSLGALTAFTRAETGRAYFLDGDEFNTFSAEPATGYGVVRAQQDLREGGSQLGIIATATRRDLPDNGSLGRLVSGAFTGGIDFEHTWGDREWGILGFLAASRISGTPEALIRVQRSPNHYFQRPDADYLAVDSAATLMSGAQWELQFERFSGRWTGAVWIGQRTPGFEVDDLGFARSSERLDGGARIAYRDITPGDLLRSWRVSAFTFGNWRNNLLDDPFSWRQWGYTQKEGFTSLSADLTFLNYWGLNLSLRHQPEYLSDSATRGGPLMLDPAWRGLEIRGNTDRRKALAFQPSFGYENGARGGENFDMGIEVSWTPTASLEIAVQPEYEREWNPAQYVAATDDIGYAPTYGARYLFSDIERRTVALETRLNWIFSPTLSLQLFAQPLLSSGDFLTYKQLGRSESFEFDTFGEGSAIEAAGDVTCVGGRTCTLDGRRYVDFEGDGMTDFSLRDRDFNVRSLRGNAVLRWEYRPGSTVFLVWQQNRIGREMIGDFALGRDAGALFDAPAENLLILKVNYWLGM